MTTDFVIFGVASSVVIKAFVNVAKQLGLSGKWPIVLAMLLGILLAAGMQLSTMYPAFETWFRVVMMGLIAGLSAAELYQVEKKYGVKQVGQP